MLGWCRRILRNLRGDSSVASDIEAPAPERRTPHIAIVAAVFIAVIAAAWMLRTRRQQPATAKTDVSSVVVLPAKVFAGPELSYLTDAVPETLSTLLAQVPYL